MKSDTTITVRIKTEWPWPRSAWFAVWFLVVNLLVDECIIHGVLK